MRPKIALAALLVAAPAAAQAPATPCGPDSNGQGVCQLGPFAIELFYDTYSPLVPGPWSWGVSLLDDRIDFTFHWSNLSAMPAPFYDPSYYPFFEQRLLYTIFPASPSIQFYRAALHGTSGATFTLPSTPSYAGLYSRFKVSNDVTGTSLAFGCEISGTTSPQYCDGSGGGSLPVPFTNLPYGLIYGEFGIDGYFSNAGPTAIVGTFGDIDLKASLYFTNLTPVPEPATIALVGTGLALVGLVGWRRRR